MNGLEEEPGFECGACHELERERRELQAKLDAVRCVNDANANSSHACFRALTKILAGTLVLRDGQLVEP